MRRCVSFCAWCSRACKPNCPGAAKVDPAHLHLGAVAFIHRFSSDIT
jgi:hypothetical protein